MSVLNERVIACISLSSTTPASQLHPQLDKGNAWEMRFAYRYALYSCTIPCVDCIGCHRRRGLRGTVVPKYLAGCKAITTILPRLSTPGSTSCVWYPVCNSPVGNSYDEGDDSRSPSYGTICNVSYHNRQFVLAER
ncbi:uncharacterized protein LACBIDRAFT_334774 [Laccaria bicolor S238N-H82]|uniref:Predicted protein n=1 Tax=Laccaria bicolor (strain S238N-H82 / ATCC MYA-4686) TaxID=486041 RepID=B0E098_LACBS|nr:uncharacterized protein LACBIDRAFT_334774 [Laccaria bicolor S238N-H82]EDQ99746.1 predicted protein [Laccaria bicolor S238N-H82]|eukprot:XP_001889582.1 predicted protein [Laccaria bicolor S238N-H82]